MVGLEPTTFSFFAKCSCHLSYIGILRPAMLPHTSGRLPVYSRLSKEEGQMPALAGSGDKRNRTADSVLAKHALSHLSYIPV